MDIRLFILVITGMPSTYTSLHYHIVFGTKNRISSIHPIWRKRLHSYLAGTIKGLGGFPQEINGISDHVHLLIGLRATHRLCDVVRETKKASSEWIHHEIGCKPFSWQEGYAAFSVGARDRKSVRVYIANQEAHHRVKSFREELLELLKDAEITFDPKYFD